MDIFSDTLQMHYQLNVCLFKSLQYFHCRKVADSTTKHTYSRHGKNRGETKQKDKGAKSTEMENVSAVAFFPNFTLEYFCSMI